MEFCRNKICGNPQTVLVSTPILPSGMGYIGGYYVDWSWNSEGACMFLVGSVVLSATFNNIAVISRMSVLLVEEIGVPGRP